MSTEAPRRAGAFDIRLIIALLLGVYGLVLTVMGIWFTTDADRAKAAGVNINLWAGIGMLVFSALFILWATTRPLLVTPPSDAVDSVPAEPGE
jgi:glucose uptake protein GlcU